MLSIFSVASWLTMCRVSIVVQSQISIWLFATPRTAAHQAPLSSTITWSLLRFMFIELVMLSNHLILSHPLLLLPSVFPSIKVFSSESALHIRWPKMIGFKKPSSSDYKTYSPGSLNFASLNFPSLLNRDWVTFFRRSWGSGSVTTDVVLGCLLSPMSCLPALQVTLMPLLFPVGGLFHTFWFL